MGQRTDDEDDFEVSGPKHMRSKLARWGWKIVIDWKNSEHRRCVVACLVKGTGVMEKDRIKCRLLNAALAPPWWESFGFELKEVFKTESIINDHFTYGAIFKLKAPSRSSPKYVVAFRGTMLFHPKVLQDLMQDTLVLFNALADNRRFKRTHSKVDTLISSNGGGGSVWLAGHSLGASLALEIGRNIMLKKGENVPTFLFNPPHVSPALAINGIMSEEHKTQLYTGSYAVKFVLANVVPGHRKRTKELFRKLAPWVPELYVNPADGICRGYIEYFQQRQLAYENHPRFASTATRTSYRDILFFRTLRPHLLPSAMLWTNSSQNMEAHGLRQWWKPDSDLALTNTHYVYQLTDSA